MKINYQIMLDSLISSIKADGSRPTLLLHACCAPCSSAVLEKLSLYFDITLYFYNPNISPEEEYSFRLSELRRLIEEMSAHASIAPELREKIKDIKIIEGKYNADEFFDMARGYEKLPEGDKRCSLCYRMRLEACARLAKEMGFDYFCTTLSISPYKNAQKLGEIGFELEKEYGIKYLPSDFKKQDGYKRSCELSEIFGLYRQNFCGCVYSMRNLLSLQRK